MSIHFDSLSHTLSLSLSDYPSLYPYHYLSLTHTLPLSTPIAISLTHPHSGQKDVVITKN